MIKLFVGLGNPGPQYESTRHNAGFWWLDRVAESLGAHLAPERGWQGLAARAEVAGERIWLLEPQTFMNRSGQSVAALARFYKIAPDEILVAHDELDLPPGHVKIKHGGGHAGHNGLRDIHSQLGSSDYWRLRLGIGHPGHRSAVMGWVLGTPSQDHAIAIQQAIDHSAKALASLVSGDMEAATRMIHTAAVAEPLPRHRSKPAAVDRAS